MTRDTVEHAGNHQSDVVIIGAGPAGLAAALEARRVGASRVTVVDRVSAHSRCRSIILDNEVLGLLSMWDVDLAAVNQVDTFSYVHGFGNSVRVDRIPFPRTNPMSPAHSASFPGANDILFRRLPRAVQQIKDLETVMLEAARRVGVEVLFDATVSGRPTAGDDSVGIEVETATGSFGLQCKYLVIADGSRSRISRLLGIKRVPCDMRSYEYTCTVFDSRRKDVLLYWVPNHPSGITEMTGLGNGARYTLVSRLPAEFSGWPDDRLKRSRLPDMIVEAASCIGINGSLVEGPMRFTTDMDHLEEVAPHRRMLCIGDAARKGDPGFGGNMNEAIRDGRRFGSYLSAALREDDTVQHAQQEFRDQVQGATRALQTGGALTNNLRSFFSIGDSAQSLLPGPLRSLIHLDVSILMRATGTMIRLMNSTRREAQDKH